jgi:hypothetical protein
MATMAFYAVLQILQILQILQNDERYLNELLESMPQRYQAVIDANGSHTRY